MKLKLLFPILVVLFTCSLTAQVGINTTDPQAQLDVSSTTQGVLFTRMSLADRGMITAPVQGLLIYQTDNNPGFYYYDGSAWISLGSASWDINGNAGTNPTTNKIGTTDTNDFNIVTDNTTGIFIDGNNGRIGLGTSTPDAKLHVVSPMPGGNIQYFDFESGSNNSNIGAPFTSTGANPKYSNEFAAGGSSLSCRLNAGNSSTTTLELDNQTFDNGGSISFARLLRTEEDYDYFYFYIDNVLRDTWSGVETAFTTESYIISPGTHSFRWEYTRDASGGSNGGDPKNKVYLDDITLKDNGVPALRIVDGNQTDGYYLRSDANGTGTWSTPAVPLNADEDWAFNSGSLNTDPIYHLGNVVIGVTNVELPTTTHNLQVWNGTTSGSTLFVGSVEFIEDGMDEIIISDDFSPLVDNSQNLGTSTRRWQDVYSVDGTINTSDVRLKDNIQPLEYGLDEVLQLRPVSYKWKEEQIGKFKIPENEYKTHLGFIAQELQEVIPEVVHDKYWYIDGEDPTRTLVQKEAEALGVSTTELIPVLVKAIQEQQEEIKALEENNKKIKALIAKRKAKK